MELLKQEKTKVTKKSSVAATGVIFGGLGVGLALFLALTANSLALWADWAATLLDFLAVIIAWQGFRKIETNSTVKFNYGFGKFESFSSLGMAVLMVVSFICIITFAISRFQHPVPIEGFGVVLGFSFHFIFGIINGSIYFRTSNLIRKDKSALLIAQQHIYLIKVIANILMFISLILSHFFEHLEWVMESDSVVATIIALLILAGATKIFRHSTRDLLDFALEEQSQLLILRSLAAHFHRYENIQDIRTRVSGGKVYVELFLEFDNSLLHSEVMETIKSLQTEISDLLKCDEVLIIPV